MTALWLSFCVYGRLILRGQGGWCPQDKRLAGAPQIHFGRASGVERTLLRIACQSETFFASPWQDDASIRVLWHIGCQSEFDGKHPRKYILTK